MLVLLNISVAMRINFHGLMIVETSRMCRSEIKNRVRNLLHDGA